MIIELPLRFMAALYFTFRRAESNWLASAIEEIEQIAAEVRKFGRKSLDISTDVVHESHVKRVIEQTISQFGRIDIVCNSAGVLIYESKESHIT